MSWSSPISLDEIEESPNAGDGATSTVITLQPGESASVEILRTDTPTEAWTYSIRPSVDGINFTDIASQRIVRFSFIRPIIGVRASDGVQYFRISILNGNLSPQDKVKAIVTYTTDGVSL